MNKKFRYLWYISRQKGVFQLLSLGNDNLIIIILMTSSIVDNQEVQKERRRGLPREHSVNPATCSAQFSYNRIQTVHSSTDTSP
jgi:hypothetical protein